MTSIKTINDSLIGYGLDAKTKNIIALGYLAGEPFAGLLPPHPELLKIKELVDFRSLNNELLGFALPTEMKQLEKVIAQFKSILNLKNETLSQACNIDWLDNIQSLIDTLEIDKSDKQKATESISLATDELNQKGKLSFSSLINLMSAIITLLITLISAYPALKEIYHDVTDNPIVEICGILNDLEKEAVKFVSVDHRGGTPLFQYPKGKKEAGFLLDGTQVCLLAEPKGNEKRVKVVYQVENHKQMYGYVERNKLKRLYK